MGDVSFEMVYLSVTFHWEKISTPLSCGPTQLVQKNAVIGIWKRNAYSSLKFWWKLDYTAEILGWASWCDEELCFRNNFWRWQCSCLPGFYLFRSTKNVAGTFSTNYSMSYLCLRFCLKVAAELSLQISARIINN